MTMMTRPRYQTGSLLIRGKRKKMYVARYYENVVGSNGRPQKLRRSIVLGPVAEIGTRRAAQIRLTELLRPINQGWQKPKTMLTFGEFVREQWETKVLCLFKFSTRNGYGPLLSRHLLPYFDCRTLSEITPAQVQGFLIEKTKAGLSWHAVRNLRNLLSRILRTAVEWGYLEVNPVSKTKLSPKPIQSKAKFLLSEQVRQLAGELKEPYRTMVLVAVLTGLSRSELFALRWGVVDLEKGTLEVREGVYMGRFSTPKTPNRVRRIPLSGPVVELLKRRKVQAVRDQPGDLVFATRKGTPIGPDNVLKRVLHPACQRLGLPQVGWHAFRHTHATLLSDLGESLKTAQAILGHADLETTLSVYTHSLVATERRAEERLARAVMDPNGPKLDEQQKSESTEAVLIQ
ncbi:MAG: tyrosine-type recombinase/integrase [Acidobacteria bacterium]|nr:tyrosine-type recombinase/integrase [Acidobacteriota bacterium]